MRPAQNKWTHGSSAWTQHRPVSTETSKGFTSQQGKVLKLVKIIWLKTAVVSSYHHPHETYTRKCWRAGFTLFLWILPTNHVWIVQHCNSTSCNINCDSHGGFMVVLLHVWYGESQTILHMHQTHIYFFRCVHIHVLHTNTPAFVHVLMST